jgi:hypothetical protein
MNGEGKTHQLFLSNDDFGHLAFVGVHFRAEDFSRAAPLDPDDFAVVDVRRVVLIVRSRHRSPLEN